MHICLRPPQLNSKEFQTKIRELKNETTVLKAQYRLAMLHPFILESHEMKPAVSPPATIQSVS
jgi:hypothetical protein